MFFKKSEATERFFAEHADDVAFINSKSVKLCDFSFKALPTADAQQIDDFNARVKAFNDLLDACDYPGIQKGYSFRAISK